MVAQTATRTMSTLNPNAPLFIPAAFTAVEDFSPEWWQLVQTCPAFRDYWLRESYDDSYDVLADEEDEFDSIDDLLDIQMELEEFANTDGLASHQQVNVASRDGEKDLVRAFLELEVQSTKSQLAWREPLKHHDKVAVRTANSPRKGPLYRIQQPRA